MKSREKRIHILIILFSLLFLINYNFLDSKVSYLLGEYEEAKIDRVIDGDTVEINGTSFRLLGINSPEMGERYYGEAKMFLEENILNKTVTLEYVGERRDKYYRKLAYIHSMGENINVKMVEKGFANYYFYDGKDKYSDDLEEAWNYCLNENVNLCEQSENVCGECLVLGSDTITNNCAFDCSLVNWEIKEEGRSKIRFNGTLVPGQVVDFIFDASDSGGSLFLRDEEGKLVLWYEGR